MLLLIWSFTHFCFVEHKCNITKKINMQKYRLGQQVRRPNSAERNQESNGESINI